MADLSKITLPNGQTYDIKDAVARAAISKHTTYEVVAELPTASSATLDSIYLVPISSSDAPNNAYKEYITIRQGEDPNYTYKWEQIGTTEVDLSDYSHTGHTHTYTKVGANTNDAKITPTGTVSQPAITVAVTNTSDADITPYSMSSAGSYTASNYTPEDYIVTDEVLIITKSSYTKESVTLPSRVQMKISASSSQPTFTGDELTHSHGIPTSTGTSGTNSK